MIQTRAVRVVVRGDVVIVFVAIPGVGAGLTIGRERGSFVEGKLYVRYDAVSYGIDALVDFHLSGAEGLKASFADNSSSLSLNQSVA